ncbi:MAG TPA: transglycosylase domain-containing protein, partial [Ktedonobacteraceae bacterium]|nr:transglycosylase domain-containing protein [Ktedonobacteraceae bacterium]
PVGIQSIAPNREERQPTPDEPAQPGIQIRPIAPNEPSVGSVAPRFIVGELVERVLVSEADKSAVGTINRPLQEQRNISIPRDTARDQIIAPDKEEGQPVRPSPVAHNIPPLQEQRNIPVQDSRQRVPVIRNLPPMPPLPMRRLPVPAPTRQKQAVISTGQRQYPHYHTLTIQQKRLGHRTRKHLRQVRAGERLARLRFWATIWSIIGILMVIFMSLGTIGYITAYDFVQHTQTTYEQQVDTLRSLVPPDNLKIYDSKSVLLAQLTDQGLHTTVKFDQIAPLLRDATVATEDKTFWTNQGVDLLRILRAALDDVQNGHVVEGGSTITQQLIKILLVGDQATIERKLKELVLTPLINNRYNKRDILEMYLNSIYYGHQAYGIDAATTVYFGLQVKPGRPAAMQLDLAQSAMLAGIPSNPNLYDPLLHSDAAYNRFAYVLGLMVAQNYITRLQAFNAIAEAQDPHFFKIATAQPNRRAPHFVELVLSELQQMFHLKSRSQLSRSGMIVYTTLDINLQDKIQYIAQQHIAELRDAHNLTNAAEVLIDFHTGAIISLLGSIDYNDASIDGQFDVATAYRQPGSSFKPYVYVTAFAQGISPAQAIDDQPISIPIPGSYPPTFSPLNYDLRFHGHMTLRCALQNSLNIPAVKVLEHVGIPAAMQTAYRMGITTYSGTPGYSLVLGGLGIRLIDHTSAMGVFANGGVRQPYYVINKIVSASTGKLLFQHHFGPGKRIISPQLAYMMTDVLSDNTARIPEFLDCNVLQLYSNSQQDCQNGDLGVVRPAAAKTGTTNDFRDNWTIGYTTDYVMGVWAGNDDNSPMIDVTGVQGAAPIWHDAMLLAEQDRPIRDFTNPGGLVRSTITYPDGVQTTDWFLPNAVPTFVLPTPTPIPTPIPTAVPVPGATPVATPTPPPASLPLPHPYCPANYNFAFAPPPPDIPPAGWW